MSGSAAAVASGANAQLKTADAFHDSLRAGEASDKSPLYTAARYLGLAERSAGALVLDVDLRLDPGALHASARREPGGYRVEVVARSYAADVTLHADRLAADALVDDGLVTLLAGERATFHVTTDAELDPAELTAAPVLRSANDLRGVALVEPPVGAGVGSSVAEPDLEGAR